MITDRLKFSTNDPSMGCLVSIFTVRISSKSFPWAVLSTHKPTQIVGNVRCPILGKPRTPLCGLANRHGRKADLNWKLKIRNTADNADITQSHAHETKRHQM